MKKYKPLFVLLTTCILWTCVEVPPERPNAYFSKDPNLIIIADKTLVPIINESSGEIDSYFWEFEDGLKTSTLENPTYTFDFEGARPIKLTVEGPGGTDVVEGHFVVFPFDPLCRNVGANSTHSEKKIRGLIEDNLIRLGNVYIKNDYNYTVEIELFDPNDWLQGSYRGKYRSGAEGCLRVSDNGNSCFNFSNAWGIRLLEISGEKSCVRTVGGISYFDGSKYPILVSAIAGG